MSVLTVPAVGMDVYIPTQIHVYRGEDDTIGGLAKVIAVKDGVSAGQPTPFVVVDLLPYTEFNWEILLKQQEELKARFGDTRACKDPDYLLDVNNDIADWH